MRLSKIQEIRQLQMLAGEGKCPWCLRELVTKTLRGKRCGPPILCWSADCRAHYDAAAKRANRLLHKQLGYTWRPKDVPSEVAP